MGSPLYLVHIRDSCVLLVPLCLPQATMIAKWVLLVLLAAAALGFKPEINLVQKFEAFKATHNRKYATAQEESKRLRIFAANMRKAERLAEMNPFATFGVNEFADVSAAEFKIRHSAEKYFTSKVAKRSAVVKNLFGEEAVKSAASSIDWRAKGAVTYVKNQGQCGSCWSFSSTGSIEGQWFLAGNPLVAVSEQELVSCDSTNDGCNGGLMDGAWAWLISAHSGQIVTEASYPYVSGTGTVPACKIPTNSIGATINGHIDLPQNEDQMATWMSSNGPISIGVDATSWQTYTGGVMTNCISSQMDHGVLAVGFDNTANPPYWIIKNSWGPTWGEDGFIRVQKGTDQCLITSSPCSSQVTRSGPTPTSGPSSPTFAPTTAPLAPITPIPSSPSSGSGSTSESSGSSQTCCFYYDSTCAAGQVCCDKEGYSYDEHVCKGNNGAKHFCAWNGHECVVK